MHHGEMAKDDKEKARRPGQKKRSKAYRKKIAETKAETDCRSR
jgi:hypothetical protein